MVATMIRILAVLLFSLFLFAAQPESDVVVKICIMPNSIHPTQDLQTVLEDFTKTHPHIKCLVTEQTWEDAWVNLKFGSNVDEEIDIVQIGSTWVGSIQSDGVLFDLSSWATRDLKMSNFLPAAWQTSGISKLRQVVAVPWFLDPRAIYFRADVFAKLGLTRKDIETWEGFESALRTIKEARLSIDGQEVLPMGIPGKNDWNILHNLSPWIWSAGGDYLNQANTASVLSTQEFLTGFSFYMGLVNRGFIDKASLSKNTNGVEQDFRQGKYAVIVNGPNELQSLTDKFDIAPYPKGPGGAATFMGGSNLAVFESSKHKEEAWEVIKYLMSDKAQIAYSKLSGFMPAVVSALNDPYIVNDSRRLVLKEAIKQGRTYPTTAFWGDIETRLTRRLNGMWDEVLSKPIGTFDIPSFIELADEEIQRILRQYKQ